MKTTMNLKLAMGRTASWLDTLPLPPALTIAVLVLMVAAGLSAVNRIGLHLGASAAPVPTLAPIIIVATQPAVLVPTAAPIQVASVRYVVAFDAPNGTALGPIPQPPISAVLARYGDGWVMVDWENGQVWLRAADVGLPDVADLEPPPAPIVVERPIYVAAQQPAAVPTQAPEQYQVLRGQPPTITPYPWATPGPIRKADFAVPDPKAGCAFVGCLPGR